MKLNQRTISIILGAIVLLVILLFIFFSLFQRQKTTESIIPTEKNDFAERAKNTPIPANFNQDKVDFIKNLQEKQQSTQNKESYDSEKAEFLQSLN